jgi:hypothetical protein
VTNGILIIRNARGLVTQAVINDIAFLAKQLLGSQDAPDTRA